MARGVIARYRDFLPVTEATPHITIGEGDTPLVAAPKLAQVIGCRELYFKLEGCNPTGSFKDRGMVLAVAKAVEEGRRSIICASTGNTSASAAAFGARCGLDTFVVVPRGNIALGKLAQALMYGARVLAIDGSFDEALNIVRAITEQHPVALVNSINPYRLEGQKTAAFEVVDELGDAPDYLCIPVGNAGNISAYWKGFCEYHQRGRAARRPRLLGFQAEGAAPIVRGHAVPNPQTVATAIRIGNPASWQLAVQARDESGGLIDMVSDAEILEAYRLMASVEGIFGEPASAAPFAGLRKLVRERRAGLDLSGARIVCVVTGSGLKDPTTAMDVAPGYSILPPTLDAVEAAMGW
ncbi:MAG: threonine synthase [Chloroflexi bacterium]|nr:threonine synthase [Chloroflexota bacterium]